MTDELKPLSKKHQKFVNEYLKRWNGTRAYMATYPKASEETARANASALLAKTNINSAIVERLNEAHMSAEEALSLLADMARGDIGEYMQTTSMGFELDVDAAKKAGITKLIKKIRQQTVIINGKDQDKEIHTQEIELYDAQSAIEKILKIHGKFTEKIDLSNTDGTLKPPQIIEIIRTVKSDD